MSSTKDSSISAPARSYGHRDKATWDGKPYDFYRGRNVVATRTRTGQSLPHYKQVIARGENATTPMSAIFDTVDADPSGESRVDYYNTYEWPYVWAYMTEKGDILLTHQDQLVTHRNPSIDPAFCDNLARARFYGRLSSMTTQFQGLTFLGELRESLHMLRRPAAALWDSANGYFSALSKRKRRSPKHWVKTASGLWLEHAFGWLPLINDTKNAYNAYLSLVKPHQPMQLISASARKEYDNSSSLSSDILSVGSRRSAMGNLYWVVTNATLKEEHIVRYKGLVGATVEAPRPSMAEAFGFTPEQFIPTAWELLPWSFLVDYFTNIGDILNASVTRTSGLKWINKTTIRSTEYFLRAEPDLKYSAESLSIYHRYGYGTSQGNQCLLKRRVVSREPNVGLSLPTLQFNFSLSDGQLGNVAALLGQTNALHSQRPVKFR